MQLGRAILKIFPECILASRDSKDDKGGQKYTFRENRSSHVKSEDLLRQGISGFFALTHHKTHLEIDFLTLIFMDFLAIVKGGESFLIIIFKTIHLR